MSTRELNVRDFFVTFGHSNCNCVTVGFAPICTQPCTLNLGFARLSVAVLKLTHFLTTA